jgi:adenine/guanine phosphoribosyltransferase-like PRPP-binding protein
MRSASWGDVNAVLNRLVRDGRIAGFWTNFSEARSSGGLHVIVVPAGLLDESGTRELRAEIVERLAPLALDPVVTVDRSGRALDAIAGRHSGAPPKPGSA